MVRELADWADAMSADALLVLVLEDLQWSDHATIDMLGALAHRRGPARLLVLATYRPVDVLVSEHPLARLRTELVRRKRARDLVLSGLARSAIERYLTVRGGGPPPAALLDFVHDRSEGHPFFMVAVVDHLLERGVIARSERAWRLVSEEALETAGISDSLREMLEREIDAVDASTRSTLESGSVVGLEFAAQAAAAGVAHDTPSHVEDCCDALARQGRIVRVVGEGEWPDGSSGARYVFRHALYRDVLYHRIPRGRRRRMHQAIGERLERGFGTAPGQVAADLAVHFEQSRDVERAVEYLRLSAEGAQRRFADREALVTIDRALALLYGGPESPERRQQEVMLWLTRGPSALVTRGYGDPTVVAECERLRALCPQLGDTPAHVLGLLTLFSFELPRGRLEVAMDLGDRALELALQVAPLLVPVAHVAAGLPRCYRGQLLDGVRHLEAVLASGDPPPGWPPSFDPALHALSQLAESALVQLGRIEEAIARGATLESHTERVGHPFGRALAHHVKARLHVQMRQPDAAVAHAEQALQICDDYELDAELRVRSSLVRGWARVQLGQATGLTNELRGFLAAFGTRMGMVLSTSFHLLVAEVAVAEARLADAYDVVEEAAVLAADTGERIDEAELHRWRARLALASRGSAGRVEAETHLRAALETARQQHARWYELRAATALAEIRVDGGSRSEGRDLVAEALQCFPDALDLPDLAAARTLLGRLG